MCEMKASAGFLFYLSWISFLAQLDLFSMSAGFLFYASWISFLAQFHFLFKLQGAEGEAEEEGGG